MRTFGKKLLCGLATTVFLSGAANAADILPPVVEHKPAGGWYLRGDIGYDFYKVGSFQQAGVTAASGSFISESIDRNGHIGVGAGYEFNNWFRADATFEVRGTEGFAGVDRYLFDCTAAGLSSGSCSGGGIITRNNMWRGSLTTQAVFLNAYVDIGTWYGFTPFVGGGVGVAFHRVHGVHDFDPSDLGGGGYALEGKKTAFAWNVQAGFGYDLNDRVTVETSYRYVNLGDATSGPLCPLPAGCGSTLAPLEIRNVAAHELRLGLRWRLGGGATYSEVGYGPGRG